MSEKVVILKEDSLKKLGYPNLDRIISTDLLKRTIWKNIPKKHFCLFVSKHDDLAGFLTNLETKIEENIRSIEDDLIEYLESISEDVTQFRMELKEILRKEKIEKEKLKEDEIFARKLQDYLKQNKKEELEKKLGSSLDKLGITVKTIPEKPKKPTINFFGKMSTPTTNTPTPDLDKSKINSNDNETIDNIDNSMIDRLANTSTNEQNQMQNLTSLNLATFFAFFQDVVKRDLIVIKDMDGRQLVVHDLDLDTENPDHEKIRLKVKPL